MIQDHDRSYYIGASDTIYVIGNWETASFEKWWGTKSGLYSSDFQNDAMKAGTAYEHKILESLGKPGMEMDRQFITGRLRINLDGNTSDCIYEVKTYRNGEKFLLKKAYRAQVQVEMYGSGIRRAYIVSYGLEKEDYGNFYRDIDLNRITMHELIYDEEFIQETYLPRFEYLSHCLDLGTFPSMNEFMEGQKKR